MKHLHRLVNWIENGDLIPAVILVSIPHYMHVLAQYDFVLVAACIGFLIDVGHYRTIKLYMRGKGVFWMVALTVFSAGFHMAFYSIGGAGWVSVLLGLAPVAVIFSLAFITRTEKLDSQIRRENSHETTSGKNGIPAETPAVPNGTHETKIPDYETYTRFNESRNGNGAIQPKELVESYGVSKSTAYRWYAQYHQEVKTPSRVS